MLIHRRSFIGTGLGTGLAAMAPAASSSPSDKVIFMGDGLSLKPLEFATILTQLAEKGDCETDAYSLGGSVKKLETRMAEVLSKEYAIYCPTGTLCNHLGVRLLAGEKRRVLIQAESHLYNDSGDCCQTLSSLNLIPLAPGKTNFTLDDVKFHVDRAEHSRVELAVGAISIESPVRRTFGETFNFNEMKSICAFARSRGIGTHLDGARLFLASPYTGVSAREYAAQFDTVFVSVSKYFNAASGGILAGPKKLLENAFNTRRMFGGGMPQAWPNAAVALHYLEGFEQRIAKAAATSNEIYAHLGNRIERVPNGSNIAYLKADEGVRRRLADRGVFVPAPHDGKIVLTTNETVARRSPEALTAIFQEALKG